MTRSLGLLSSSVRRLRRQRWQQPQRPPRATAAAAFKARGLNPPRTFLKFSIQFLQTAWIKLPVAQHTRRLQGRQNDNKVGWGKWSSKHVIEKKEQNFLNCQLYLQNCLLQNLVGTNPNRPHMFHRALALRRVTAHDNEGISLLSLLYVYPSSSVKFTSPILYQLTVF